MSNGRKQDEREVDEEDVAEISGGRIPLDGYIPEPVHDPDDTYPRFPGGPIVKIDPPVKPSIE